MKWELTNGVLSIYGKQIAYPETTDAIEKEGKILARTVEYWRDRNLFCYNSQGERVWISRCFVNCRESFNRVEQIDRNDDHILVSFRDGTIGTLEVETGVIDVDRPFLPWESRNGALYVQGKHVPLPADCRSVIEFQGVIVALLDWSEHKQSVGNVCGVSKTGQLLWQLNPEPFLFFETCVYYLSVEDGRFYLEWSLGYRSMLNVYTGETSDFEVWRG